MKPIHTALINTAYVCLTPYTIVCWYYVQGTSTLFNLGSHSDTIATEHIIATISTCTPCTLDTPPPMPPHACTHTHLVPVLWIYLEFFNEVACYLTVSFLGCPVQHVVSIAVLLMDPCPKHQRQKLDHLQMPTKCSLVHSILAVLYTEWQYRLSVYKGAKMSSHTKVLTHACTQTCKTRVQQQWCCVGGVCKWMCISCFRINYLL